MSKGMPRSASVWWRMETLKGPLGSLVEEGSKMWSSIPTTTYLFPRFARLIECQIHCQRPRSIYFACTPSNIDSYASRQGYNKPEAGEPLVRNTWASMMWTWRKIPWVPCTCPICHFISDKIMATPFPPKFKMFNLVVYDKKGDLKAYADVFNT